MKIQHKVGDCIEIKVKAMSEIDKIAFPGCNIVIVPISDLCSLGVIWQAIL